MIEDVVAQFREAMASHGLVTPDEIIGDGKLHRVYIEGDSRGKLNGWFVLHIDERPAGAFGSWKHGIDETWTAKIEKKLTAAERRDLEKRMSEQRRQREEEERRVNEETSARAEEIWKTSELAFEQHPYLVRKAIKPYTIRESGHSLVVPMRDGDGKLWSLQFIKPDGEKRFLSGGKKHGCYFTISKTKPDPQGAIAVCEGFATAASIHAATDLPVVVAFDSGNLSPVAQVLRAKFPRAAIIVCADNDQWTKRPVENPGVHFAREAAQAIRGCVAIPQFQHASETNKISDFNDLATSEGLGRVAEIIESAVPQTGCAEETHTLSGVRLVEPQLAQVEGNGPLATDQTRATLPTSQDFEIDDELFYIPGGLAVKPSQIATALAEATKSRIIYDETRDRFHVFNRVWRPATEGDIQRSIQRVFDRKISGGYSSNHLHSVFSLFKLKIGRGKDRPVSWDERGYVPVQNGLINLELNQLESFDKEKQIDWILPYEFKPDSECPTFDILIERLSSGNAETHRLLMTYLAAIIRCRSDLQKYLELVGMAGSGKSSYMRVAQMLVGQENTVSSNMRHLGSNRFETAGFYGKRLAIFPDEREHVAEGTDVFKALTGGDGIRYEQKGVQQGENFIFTGMVIVAANSPMTFEDYSGAIPRRRMTVHIDYMIRPQDRDPHFFAKLATEMPGVLNKLLLISNEEIESVFFDRDGARTHSTRRALVETNPVYDWFDQSVVIADGYVSYIGSLARENGILQSADTLLYPNYVHWLEANGKRGTITLRKFVATLRELLKSMQLPVRELTKNSRGIPWQGMKLRSEWDCAHPTPITGQTILPN